MELNKYIVRLTRPSTKLAWGFRIIGGADFVIPLEVSSVFEESPASKAGLNPGDIILKICNKLTKSLTHQEARNAIMSAQLVMDLIVKRNNEEKIAQSNTSILTKSECSSACTYSIQDKAINQVNGEAFGGEKKDSSMIHEQVGNYLTNGNNMNNTKLLSNNTKVQECMDDAHSPKNFLSSDSKITDCACDPMVKSCVQTTANDSCTWPHKSSASCIKQPIANQIPSSEIGINFSLQISTEPSFESIASTPSVPKSSYQEKNSFNGSPRGHNEKQTVRNKSKDFTQQVSTESIQCSNEDGMHNSIKGAPTSQKSDMICTCCPVKSFLGNILPPSNIWHGQCQQAKQSPTFSSISSSLKEYKMTDTYSEPPDVFDASLPKHNSKIFERSNNTSYAIDAPMPVLQPKIYEGSNSTSYVFDSPKSTHNPRLFEGSNSTIVSVEQMENGSKRSSKQAALRLSDRMTASYHDPNDTSAENCSNGKVTFTICPPLDKLVRVDRRFIDAHNPLDCISRKICDQNKSVMQNVQLNPNVRQNASNKVNSYSDNQGQLPKNIASSNESNSKIYLPYKNDIKQQYQNYSPDTGSELFNEPRISNTSNRKLEGSSQIGDKQLTNSLKLPQSNFVTNYSPSENHSFTNKQMHQSNMQWTPNSSLNLSTYHSTPQKQSSLKLCPEKKLTPNSLEHHLALQSKDSAGGIMPDTIRQLLMSETSYNSAIKQSFPGPIEQKVNQFPNKLLLEDECLSPSEIRKKLQADADHTGYVPSPMPSYTYKPEMKTSRERRLGDVTVMPHSATRNYVAEEINTSENNAAKSNYTENFDTPRHPVINTALKKTASKKSVLFNKKTTYTFTSKENEKSLSVPNDVLDLLPITQKYLLSPIGCRYTVKPKTVLYTQQQNGGPAVADRVYVGNTPPRSPRRERAKSAEINLENRKPKSCYQEHVDKVLARCREQGIFQMSSREKREKEERSRRAINILMASGVIGMRRNPSDKMNSFQNPNDRVISFHSPKKDTQNKLHFGVSTNQDKTETNSIINDMKDEMNSTNEDRVETKSSHHSDNASINTETSIPKFDSGDRLDFVGRECTEPETEVAPNTDSNSGRQMSMPVKFASQNVTNNNKAHSADINTKVGQKIETKGTCCSNGSKTSTSNLPLSKKFKAPLKPKK